MDITPTTIRPILDHLELSLFAKPCMILAIPRNNNPTDSKVTNNRVVIIGNAITTIPNPILKHPI